jgi:glutathione peroxidase-family protein
MFRSGGFRPALAALSLVLALAAFPAAARTPGPDPDSGDAMLGKPAPEWAFTRWVGPELTQEQLRGKVVLLRWWTVGCHFCESTLPEIESLRERYGKDGFVAIGVFHPKPPGPVKNAEVKRAAAKRGFHGPIAIDQDWDTLSRYWLAGNPERNWTSVSFLIDREGNVVWVHGGGEYHHTDDPKHARCDRQINELEAKLDELFGRKSGGPTSLAR